MDSLGLAPRQREAVALVLRFGRVTNRAYREATGLTRQTGLRDLQDLVNKGVLEMAGAGRGACYVLKRKTRH